MKNKNIQTEVDAWYLYEKLAEHEPDKTVANVFSQMSAIEKGHAEAFAKKKEYTYSYNNAPIVACQNAKPYRQGVWV